MCFYRCPAKLTVKLYRVKCDNPLELMFRHVHNHPTDSQRALADLKLTESTKKTFKHYFSMGLTGCKAIQMHEAKLLATEGVVALANNQLNPKRSAVYYLWRKYTTEKYGDITGN